MNDKDKQSAEEGRPFPAPFPDVDLVVARPLGERLPTNYFSGKTLTHYGDTCYRSGFNAALEQDRQEQNADTWRTRYLKLHADYREAMERIDRQSRGEPVGYVETNYDCPFCSRPGSCCVDLKKCPHFDGVIILDGKQPAEPAKGPRSILALIDKIERSAPMDVAGRAKYLHDLRALLTSYGNAASAEPIELQGVAETLAEGDGLWRSCTGCHELNEGHDTGPYSKTLKCHLGGGCSECGGIGAIWDTTDYQAMVDEMAQSMNSTVAAQPATSAAAIHYPDCWDTAAYPTVESALVEVYEHYRCTQCPPAASAEHTYAEQEGKRNAAADGYFNARARLMDTSHNRRIFEAGFDRGYESAPVAAQSSLDSPYASDALRRAVKQQAADLVIKSDK